MDPDQFGALVVSVRDAALAMVRDRQGVRVEDYLTVLASATGEAVVVDAGLFDIEHNELVPGSAVFGDALNVLLSGDVEDVAAADPSSVVGMLRDQLVPAILPLDTFPPLRDLYEHVARHVGSQAWGTVATSVPDENQPRVLPLRTAFELRPAVTAAMTALTRDLGAGRPSPHVVCTMALASAIAQTAGAIEPRIGLRLALEVVFGMAKTVPMSVAAIEQATREG